MVLMEVINTVTGELVSTTEFPNEKAAYDQFRELAETTYGVRARRCPSGLFVEIDGEAVLDCIVYKA